MSKLLDYVGFQGRLKGYLVIVSEGGGVGIDSTNTCMFCKGCFFLGKNDLDNLN